MVDVTGEEAFKGSDLFFFLFRFLHPVEEFQTYGRMCQAPFRLEKKEWMESNVSCDTSESDDAGNRATYLF